MTDSPLVGAVTKLCTYVSPSPLPLGSQEALRKSSILKVAPGVLLSVPCTLVVPPVRIAEVNTG